MRHARLNSLRILVVAWQILTQVIIYFSANHPAKGLDTTLSFVAIHA